ncbi:MAG: hypothetical protein WDN48_06215 [Pseudolabrys sp.]
MSRDGGRRVVIFAAHPFCAFKLPRWCPVRNRRRHLALHLKVFGKEFDGAFGHLFGGNCLRMVVEIGLEHRKRHDLTSARCAALPCCLGRCRDKGCERDLGFLDICRAKAAAAHCSSSGVIPAGVPDAAPVGVGLGKVVVADLETVAGGGVSATTL